MIRRATSTIRAANRQRWRHLCCAAVTVLAAGCVHDPEPLPLLSVTLYAWPLGVPLRYALVGQVGNFDAERHIRAELVLGSDDGSQPDRLLTTVEMAADYFELRTDPLLPELDYHARLRVVPEVGYDPTVEVRWRTKTAPPDDPGPGDGPPP
jgi:hypothetical protein